MKVKSAIIMVDLGHALCIIGAMRLRAGTALFETHIWRDTPQEEEAS